MQHSIHSNNNSNNNITVKSTATIKTSSITTTTTIISRFKPSTHYRSFILFLLFLSILSPLTVEYLFNINIDSCSIDRNELDYKNQLNSTEHHQPWSYEIELMLLFLFNCCILKSIYYTGSNSSTTSNSQSVLSLYNYFALLKLLLSYIIYLISYFLCQALKSLLNDSNCSLHSNSVSGHYLFFCYTIITLGHLHYIQNINKNHHQQQHSSNNSIINILYQLIHTIPNKLFLLNYLGYSIYSIHILLDTYYYGYHSLRQIFYGIILALVIHYLLLEILEFIELILVKHYYYQHQIQNNTTNTAIININNNPNELSYIQQFLHRYTTVSNTTANQSLNPIFNRLLLLLFVLHCSSYILVLITPIPSYYRIEDIIVSVIVWIGLIYLQRTKLKINSNKLQKLVS